MAVVVAHTCLARSERSLHLQRAHQEVRFSGDFAVAMTAVAITRIMQFQQSNVQKIPYLGSNLLNLQAISDKRSCVILIWKPSKYFRILHRVTITKLKRNNQPECVFVKPVYVFCKLFEDEYVGQADSRMKDYSHVRGKLQLPTSDISRLPAHKSL